MSQLHLKALMSYKVTRKALVAPMGLSGLGITKRPLFSLRVIHRFTFFILYCSIFTFEVVKVNRRETKTLSPSSPSILYAVVPVLLHRHWNFLISVGPSFAKAAVWLSVSSDPYSNPSSSLELKWKVIIVSSELLSDRL